MKSSVCSFTIACVVCQKSLLGRRTNFDFFDFLTGRLLYWRLLDDWRHIYNDEVYLLDRLYELLFGVSFSDPLWLPVGVVYSPKHLLFNLLSESLVFFFLCSKLGQLLVTLLLEVLLRNFGFRLRLLSLLMFLFLVRFSNLFVDFSDPISLAHLSESVNLRG